MLEARQQDTRLFTYTTFLTSPAGLHGFHQDMFRLLLWNTIGSLDIDLVSDFTSASNKAWPLLSWLGTI